MYKIPTINLSYVSLDDLKPSKGLSLVPCIPMTVMPHRDSCVRDLSLAGPVPLKESTKVLTYIKYVVYVD